MKHIIVGLSVVVVIVLSFSGSRQAITYPGGAPAGNTGATVLGEPDCYTAGCHQGTDTLNYPKLKLQFTADTLRKSYYPDSIYPMTLTLGGQPAITNYGFQLVAIDDSLNNAGSLIAGTKQRVDPSNGKQYLNQNGRSYSGIWNFTWKAPHRGTGKVTFYVAAYGGLSQWRSRIYTNSFVYPEHLPTGLEKRDNEVENFSIFPNPANEFTEAQFFLKNGNWIEFGLYNLKGQKMENLSKSYFNQGNNSIKLRFPENIKPGIYILNLVNGPMVSSRKLEIVH